MATILTLPRKPTVSPNLEVYSKIQKLRRLSDALVANKDQPPSAAQIQQKQNLLNQRKSLADTMPKIRLVSSREEEAVKGFGLRSPDAPLDCA